MSAPQLEGAPSRLPSKGLVESAESRITHIETQIESLATKEDLQKLKAWILGGLAAAGLAIVVVALGAFFREIFSQMFISQSSPSSATAYSPPRAPSVPSEQQYQVGVGCDDLQTH